MITPHPVAPPAPPVPAPAPAPAPAPKAEPKTEGRGPVLMEGHAGEPVKKLQERLKALGFDPGAADGIFGPKTLAAVKAFQQAKGLEVDGVVGKQTWGALGIVVTGQPHEARPASAPKYPEDGNGIVNTPDGPMVRRMGALISVKIADQFDRLVEAARKDGVTIAITSGYRSYDEQVVLWNKYGRNPARVARPGTSNHQKGEAIDFKNIGNAWAWLKQNAHKFGFHNYPPEPWHYSLNGR
ncbi:MAG: peptidoglycan-binding protein [Candidatus Sericytochromatia bacterium]